MEKVIKVLGRGKAKFEADKTDIRVTFSDREDEYNQCVSRLIKDTYVVKKVLTNLGFDKNELKTKKFNVRPVYESEKQENGRYRSILIGYAYNQEIKFSFPVSNERLTEVCNALENLQMDVETDISYSIYDVDKAKDAAICDAIKDANKKAELIARNAELEIDSILNIEYGPKVDDYDYDCFSTGMRSCDLGVLDINPEEITTKDYVTITYKLK